LFTGLLFESQNSLPRRLNKMFVRKLN